MLFNSGPFLLCFLPLALFGFWALGRAQSRLVVGWLVLASLVFYAFWKPAFVLVLLGSILANFAFSRLIARSREPGKRRWLYVGVATNLGALGYFKYLFPLLQFAHEIGLSDRGWGTTVLPLGISFFTFTQIAYLVDLSQGEAEPEGLLNYAFFVTFFPHLIAGPILHHREIMPQVSGKGALRLNPNDVSTGLSWFVLGLAKKTIVADHLAPIANHFFDAPGAAPASVAWIGVLSYSMQLYFDFSGYSDMAVGLARLFSIEFPPNFASPYKSTSIIQFWQRWHMTLTRYLTLYLYGPISLAINRRRVARGLKVNKRALGTLSGFAGMLAAPTLLTMILAGIWHGAGCQFLVFGLLHGMFLTVNHAFRTFRPAAERSARSRFTSCVLTASSVLLTYGCVLTGQIFFRAGSVSDACKVLANLVGAHGLSSASLLGGGSSGLREGALLLLLYPFVWAFPNTQEWLGQTHAPQTEVAWVWSRLAWRVGPAHAALIGGLFLAAVLSMTDTATFLYFQF